MGVPSSRKLWRALREVGKCLRSQSAWLVNHAERYRAGLCIGTSVTEGTANFLVNLPLGCRLGGTPPVQGPQLSQITP